MSEELYKIEKEFTPESESERFLNSSAKDFLEKQGIEIQPEMRLMHFAGPRSFEETHEAFDEAYNILNLEKLAGKKEAQFQFLAESFIKPEVLDHLKKQAESDPEKKKAIDTKLLELNNFIVQNQEVLLNELWDEYYIKILNLKGELEISLNRLQDSEDRSRIKEEVKSLNSLFNLFSHGRILKMDNNAIDCKNNFDRAKNFIRGCNQLKLEIEEIKAKRATKEQKTKEIRVEPTELRGKDNDIPDKVTIEDVVKKMEDEGYKFQEDEEPSVPPEIPEALLATSEAPAPTPEIAEKKENPFSVASSEVQKKAGDIFNEILNSLSGDEEDRLADEYLLPVLKILNLSPGDLEGNPELQSQYLVEVVKALDPEKDKALISQIQERLVKPKQLETKEQGIKVEEKLEKEMGEPEKLKLAALMLLIQLQDKGRELWQIFFGPEAKFEDLPQIKKEQAKEFELFTKTAKVMCEGKFALSVKEIVKLGEKQPLDLDSRTALGLLESAGLKTDKVKHLEPGKETPEYIHLDVGNRRNPFSLVKYDKEGKPIEKKLEEVTLDDLKGLTIFLDHHGPESKKGFSATRQLYEVLTAGGFLEKKSELNNLVQFINCLDDKLYDQLDEKRLKTNFREHWLNSDKTTLGLAGYMEFEDLRQLFFDPKFDLLAPLTADQLKTIQSSERQPRSLEKVSEYRRKMIDSSDERVKKLISQGYCFETADGKKAVVDLEGTLWESFEAAKANNLDLIIKYSLRNNSFNLSAIKGELPESFKDDPRGIWVRGGMWLKKSINEQPLDVRLSEIISRLGGAKEKLPERLQEFLKGEEGGFNYREIYPTGRVKKSGEEYITSVYNIEGEEGKCRLEVGRKGENMLPIKEGGHYEVRIIDLTKDKDGNVVYVVIPIEEIGGKKDESEKSNQKKEEAEGEKLKHLDLDKLYKVEASNWREVEGGKFLVNINGWEIPTSERLNPNQTYEVRVKPIQGKSGEITSYKIIGFYEGETDESGREESFGSKKKYELNKEYPIKAWREDQDRYILTVDAGGQEIEWPILKDIIKNFIVYEGLESDDQIKAKFVEIDKMGKKVKQLRITEVKDREGKVIYPEQERNKAKEDESLKLNQEYTVTDWQLDPSGRCIFTPVGKPKYLTPNLINNILPKRGLLPGDKIILEFYKYVDPKTNERSILPKVKKVINKENKIVYNLEQEVSKEELADLKSSLEKNNTSSNERGESTEEIKKQKELDKAGNKTGELSKKGAESQEQEIKTEGGSEIKIGTKGKDFKQDKESGLSYFNHKGVRIYVDDEDFKPELKRRYSWEISTEELERAKSKGETLSVKISEAAIS